MSVGRRLCLGRVLGMAVTLAPGLWAQDMFDGLGAPGRPGQGWTVNAGAIVLSTPQYPGSDERRLLPLPVLSADYEGRWFIGGSRAAIGVGVGYRALRSGPFTIDLGLGVGEGRREDRADALAGMGNRSVTAWGGTNLGYRLGPLGFRVNVVRALTQEGGTRATLATSFNRRLGERWGFGVSASAGFADAANLAFDFGITPEQAATRAQLLALGDRRLRVGDAQAFAPKAGLRELGAGVSVNYLAAPRWRYFLFTSVNHLSDEVSLSPLVRQRDTVSAGLGFLYSF